MICPETKPILVGHSFGGLIAQELLAAGHAAAAAIDPAGIKGVKALAIAQLRSAFPALGNPANRHRAVSLTAQQFRYAFGNTLPEEASDALYEAWSIPGPGRPIFQEASANFSRHSPTKVDTHLAERGPLLLTSGTKDHVVPYKVAKEVFEMYQKGPSDTEFREFEGRGHSLTIDSGWKDVADTVLQWFATKDSERPGRCQRTKDSAAAEGASSPAAIDLAAALDPIEQVCAQPGRCCSPTERRHGSPSVAGVGRAAQVGHVLTRRRTRVNTQGLPRDSVLTPAYSRKERHLHDGA